LIVISDARPHSGPSPQEHSDALVNVANRPLVHHVIDALAAAGVEDVIVTSSIELAPDVRVCLEPWRRGETIHMQHLEHGPPLDLTGAISLAAPLIGSAPCIVHPGSVLLDAPLSPLVSRFQGDGPTVALLVEPDGPEPEQDLYTGAVTVTPDHCATAIGLFGPDAVRLVGEQSAADRGGAWSTLAEALDPAGVSVDVIPVPAWHEYTGDPLDLLELNRIALERLSPDRLRPVTDGNRIEGRVQIHPSATVRASVIVGPAVIGPGATIANAYIGPYTSIGPRARIEGAEIERSIIGADASITHIGRRLFSSIVGRNARVHRDMSLPRALRLMVGDETEVAVC
jgi:glucose-1-phosphate thymidylyltransferase